MSTDPQVIANAVVSWLNYKNLTGLKGLFTEAAIGIPIAELLSTKYGQEIESERKHPVFDSAKGRPRQIDFVRVKRDKLTWYAAYECKFMRISFEGIVSDLCRLLCLNQAKGIGKPEKYFIFAGKLGRDDELLKCEINTGDGSRIPAFKDILALGSCGKKGVDCKKSFRPIDLHPKQRQAFQTFARDYKVSLPSKIVTNLEGWCIHLEFGCAVWRVTAESGSRLLSHEELA